LTSGRFIIDVHVSDVFILVAGGIVLGCVFISLEIFISRVRASKLRRRRLACRYSEIWRKKTRTSRTKMDSFKEEYTGRPLYYHVLPLNQQPFGTSKGRLPNVEVADPKSRGVVADQRCAIVVRWNDLCDARLAVGGSETTKVVWVRSGVNRPFNCGASVSPVRLACSCRVTGSVSVCHVKHTVFCRNKRPLFSSRTGLEPCFKESALTVAVRRDCRLISPKLRIRL
uniref:Ig-like domain-containing protein n=1 Tax=Soboliphyme baturini TaxID=241478 RepID=A0A183IZD1_9BILA